ncbi:MAG: sigma-70 family RNA polymerase sigma factor, partial [Clostridia bacterium]|nr:sigma-70 family RNA polymerase sigma factor [Clostridia bacterium]
MVYRFKGKRINQAGDEELINEFTSSRDLEILGDLYLSYMHLVYGVCLKYLKDREEAMDAVMQIFEKLIIEIPKQRIESFRSWLHVVTKNYCLMLLRSKKSNDEKYNEWLLNQDNFMENSYYVHPIDSEDHYIDEVLADCIEKLNIEQKECIQQFYYADRCYREIAINLGIDEKKVKSNLQNGKRNL